MKHLTESQCLTIANALRVAATVYKRDAILLRDHNARAADQFEDQELEATKLADAFEDADSATIREGVL